MSRNKTEGKRQTAPTRGLEEGNCGEICRYLKIWCTAIGLSGGAETSCTIGQVSNCLLGEGALDDVGIIAILLQAGGQLHIHMVTYSHTYTHISTLIKLMRGDNINKQSQQGKANSVKKHN